MIHDPTDSPHFLWDEPLTRYNLKKLLNGDNEEERLYYASKILREARFEEIWDYLSPAFLPYHWEKLLIPDVDAASQVPIVALVDQILLAKKKNPNADVSSLEAEIDPLVYSLYGLTRQEIAFGEESLQEKTVDREVAGDLGLEQQY